MARAPQVMANIATLQQLRSDSPGVANPVDDQRTLAKAVTPGDNPALEEWKALRQTSA